MKKNDFKKAIKSAVKAATGQEDELIYLASGFFTPEQKETLETFEELLDNQEKNYFSPRLHTVDFTKANKTLKPALIKEIFQSNVDNINKSAKCHFFLDTSMGGKFDQGTVWELGFAIANYVKEGKSLDNLVLHLPNDGQEFVFEEMLKNLTEVAETYIKDKESIVKSDEASITRLICKDNVVDAASTIDLLGYNMNQAHLPGLLNSKTQILDLLVSKGRLVVVDNTPIQSVTLMGFFHGLGVDYRTASVQGYGSNVMIAASSKGHIKLPGLYDETKSNTQID